uniref:F-box domain-containing protein n=1 Tax=Globodera pallida TaxID=36090 RepID=A0A183BXD6_GLOPA
MSDNTIKSEQQQQMKEIYICDDIWYGVFDFICPFDLGQKMALISDRLDVLVDVHFKSRKWSLDWLQIRRANDGNGAQIVNKRFGEGLPIPQGPLPNKVISFERIWIRYVDQTVIDFLQRIRRLFNFSGTNVDIDTGYYESRNLEIIWQKIWPLINDNICRFLLYFPYHLDRLQQFSSTVLYDCANLRSIDSIGPFPEFPAEDNAGASSAQAVAKWLLTPRGDGLPKTLYCDFYSAKIEGVKRSFVNASEPVNFIIRFSLHFDVIKPFELKNNWTRERLTLRQMHKYNWLLVRCPIGREEDKWTNWETEDIGCLWWRQWNRITINFNDSDIGYGDGSRRPQKISEIGIPRPDDDDGFVPFELKNILTKERLTFRRINEFHWVLVRCPIVREEDKWANWEKETIGCKWWRPWNRITINFNGSDIGCGGYGLK